MNVHALWINPHAHYLAREMKGFAKMPDGRQKPLFLIKQWDFNWQGDYTYREPLFLPKGTEVGMEYTYDNSDANPQNPNHLPRRVQFGQESTDEMGELWIQVLTRNGGDRLVLENDLQFKNFAEMTRYYEHRLRLDPNDAQAHDRLGLVKNALGQGAEAVDHFRRAIELDSNDDEPHVHLGMIWLARNNTNRPSQNLKRPCGLIPMI